VLCVLCLSFSLLFLPPAGGGKWAMGGRRWVVAAKGRGSGGKIVGPAERSERLNNLISDN